MNIADLQKRLKKFKLDGYIITRNNMFLGQDVRPEENLILQLTKFSGSAGTLLILPQQAILFIDGRYELQAPQEVDSQQITTFCTTQMSFAEWLNQNMPNKNIGYNPWNHNLNIEKQYSAPQMIPAPEFLPNIQSSHQAKVFTHDIQFCGQSREEKIYNFAQELKAHNLQAAIICSADCISWLLNLRSNALAETPVFRGMLLIDSSCHIWTFADNVDTSALPSNLKILPFAELGKRLKKFKKQNVGCVPEHTPIIIAQQAQEYNINLRNMPDICSQLKAIKNTCELEGMRKSHIRDAVAMCKFLHWLDNNWQNKSELDIVKELHRLRSQGTNFVSESFATIAGFNENAAIIHYQPTKNTNKVFDTDGVLLLDSGAQYFDGTTDITRTIALGNPPHNIIDDFTLVLKGHINLCSSIFPPHTSGQQLDVLARQFLWEEGKNYNHGTGHGVGCFLNVHEGPHNISPRSSSFPLCEGMITSIEPGYYLADHYGIRIENLYEVVATSNNMLTFQYLTLVPIDKRLINKYLLDNREIEWLNNYHQQIWEKISPLLSGQDKEWLQEACSPL